MLLTKTPLRVSLFGGGTDYPAFCDRYDGMVLGGTINKYVYITATRLFSLARENIRLSYRETESALKIDDIKHPIVREYLRSVKFDMKYAFYTVSDIPGSSGLGGSSAFSVGFINLVQYLLGNKVDADWLAKEAVHLERNILNEPVGLQDQYHAAFGGFSTYRFRKNGTVDIEPVVNIERISHVLDKHSVLIFTGNFRSARNILADQVINTQLLTKDDYLLQMREICIEACKLFQGQFTEESLKEIGELLDESWNLKSQLAESISNKNIDQINDMLRDLGAYGAKVLGAGGGGFVLGIGDGNLKTKAIEKFGRDNIVDFKFTNHGSRIIELGA